MTTLVFRFFVVIGTLGTAGAVFGGLAYLFSIFGDDESVFGFIICGVLLAFLVALLFTTGAFLAKVLTEWL